MDPILRVLVAGGFLNIARLQPASVKGGRCQYKTLIGGHLAGVHPTSCMFGKKPQPPFIVYNEIVLTKRSYLRGVSLVDPVWLPELAPQWFKRMSTDTSVEMHEGSGGRGINTSTSTRKRKRMEPENKGSKHKSVLF